MLRPVLVSVSVFYKDYPMLPEGQIIDIFTIVKNVKILKGLLIHKTIKL